MSGAAGLSRCAVPGRSMSISGQGGGGGGGGGKAFGGVTYLITCWEAGRAPAIVAEEARSRRAKYALKRQKTFAEFTYMNKDDHDRERQRWHARMEEVEARLAESETLNSDMNQIKAELNKKIVELERNQRPLIEQNRKLTERNRNLVQELKRLESKIAHQMDDFLTLKDSHDRVVKENSILRRERTFPEKLEELDRYRNQVLEYSKCITALRQAGLEKDRRYEVLVLKLKRLRRVQRGEDDRQSTVGSDCSTESTISLDTITQDLEETVQKELSCTYEALYRENEELAKALHTMGGDEATLREQLAFARATIAQQQIVIDSCNERADASSHYKQVLARQSETLHRLEEEVERLQRELATSEEQRELLEFQAIESEYGREEEHERQASGSLDDDVPEIEYPPYKPSDSEIRELKQEIRDLRKAGNLTAAQRRWSAKGLAYLEALENQWSEHEDVCAASGKDLNGNSAHLLEEVCDLSKELGRVKFQLQTRDEELAQEKKVVEEMQRRISSTGERKTIEMTQLEEEMKKQMGEMDALKESLNKSKNKLKIAEGERIKLQGDVNVLRAECERLKNEQRPAVKSDLERRFEETRFRLAEAMQKIDKYELVIDAARRVDDNRSSFADELQKELEDCKQFNEHMERQFKAQTDMIDTLKHRLISNKLTVDFLGTIRPMHPDQMQRAIFDFSRKIDDDGARRTVSLVADIVERCMQHDVLDGLKLRECRSTDSGGDSISNGSEGTSSGRHSEDEDWQKNHQRGPHAQLRVNGTFSAIGMGQQ